MAKSQVSPDSKGKGAMTALPTRKFQMVARSGMASFSSPRLGMLRLNSIAHCVGLLGLVLFPVAPRANGMPALRLNMSLSLCPMFPNGLALALGRRHLLLFPTRKKLIILGSFVWRRRLSPKHSVGFPVLKRIPSGIIRDVKWWHGCMSVRNGDAKTLLISIHDRSSIISGSSVLRIFTPTGWHT